MRASGIRKRISSIKFGLLSPQEIRKMSATKIITADTYDEDSFPIEMGLMDPRLGVIEPGLRCKTCGHKVDECPGHFGHIDLAMPVIHVGYTKLIKTLLKATCRSCGKLLLSEASISGYREDLEEYGDYVAASIDLEEMAEAPIKDAIQVKVCPHCGEEQKKITLDKPTTFREDGHKLTPKEVRERMERIPDEHLAPLGLDRRAMRPEWTILTALPVPPVTVRPSITLESGDRSEDDLTHKLVDVLRINQRLRENRDAGAPQLIVEDLWELLQYHVTTYFDNQTSGIPPARHRSGRPLKTLAQRLKGKEGRFRSNLSGKRVNFSARTVISPDPFLSLNEVGVPMAVAMELTIPIHVTESNIEMCRAMVLRGPDNYPGVNYVIRPDGRRIKLTEKNSDTVTEGLELDYIIERHLRNGDAVLFNRQPSLHRMSIMSHQVKVIEGKTFRFNLVVCPPYNADFDGDEMNLHGLQCEEARAEAEILMKVQEHILSPRFGGPVIGGIHDYISGAFLLTHKSSKFNKHEALQILAYIQYREPLPTPDVVDKDGTEWWYGKTLVSLTLPEDLHMEYRSSICTDPNVDKKGNDPDDSFVIIHHGILEAGTIDENSVGAFKGRLIDQIVRRYGPERGARFIDEVTRMAVGAIMIRGFSTSIDDEDIPEEARKQIAALLVDVEREVDSRVQAYQDGTLNQLPGRSLEETLEVEVMRELGRARDEAGQIAGRELGLENSAVIMARSGARGSMLNLSQMAGCIGQQAVRGERIKRGYRGRTLPHFEVGALGAGAKGFVESSYKSGLSPTEYFFHAMGGREGLVDTAVRTSRSGYMQRRLINALEDIKIMYDGTVRNTAGTIIQFVYGEDGIDPSRSIQGKAIDLDDIIRETIGYDTEYDFEMFDQENLSFSAYEDLKIEADESEFDTEEVE